MEKIVIVGAGAAGGLLSILIKRRHPDYDVTIIEHLDKPFKKIKATGNGKCNLGNSFNIKDEYSNVNFVKSIIGDQPSLKQKPILESLGFKIKNIDGLLYPYSESSQTVIDALIKNMALLQVKLLLNTDFLDYSFDKNKYIIKLKNHADITADKIIFTCGGKASSQLGSDGSVYNILQKHGYDIVTSYPALGPVLTKESTKLISGLRIKSNVTLLQNGYEFYKESGEVLFKDKGLSGIVIFNCLREIVHTDEKNISILVDLFPNIPSINNFDDDAIQYLHPDIINYVNKNKNILYKNKYLKYTYNKPYGFEFSHISTGGVALFNINKSLESTIEKNVYFAGEVLDIDAKCGGYNLMWAFGSAIHIANNI